MKLRSPGDPIVLTKELSEMRDNLTPKQIDIKEDISYLRSNNVSQ